MQEDKIRLEESWKQHLYGEFAKPYMQELKGFLKKEYNEKKIIYPRTDEFFAAFNLVPFGQVRVVIIGQDPYHGHGQAHGLCFSVRPGVTSPPSLKNIFKEIKADLNISPPDHGCLIPWAKQGVLLINSVLTVRQGEPGSHRNRGWEVFTDRVVALLNEHGENLIFVLWGNYAQNKGKIIDRSRHLVLEAAHPSPMSAERGFLGCRHFSKINDYLVSVGGTPINWCLPQKADLA